MSKLEIEGARVRFGNYEALKGVSFKAEDRQFVTLLGPSGCGKTTLLKAIAGFIELDSGSIRIDGAAMGGTPPERRDTAMCFQSYALFPHLTVAENIVFGLRQKRLSAAEIATRLTSIATQVSLGAQLEKLPAQLSGGQQQRVALARALAMRPGVMLFDEPLSNLDAKLRDQVRLEIRQLQRDHGFTAVYVTHDQAEALAMSDLVIVMNAGAIEQMGSPHEIYHRPKNRFVADFVGTANIVEAKITQRDASNNLYGISTPLGHAQVLSQMPPVADRIYISWRPEDMELAEGSGRTDNVFPLTVRSRTFLGNVTDITLSLPNGAGQACRAQTLGYSHLSEGKAYNFRISPHKIHFLQEMVA